MSETKYTFFWGGNFSNFHPADFIDQDGIKYSCTEQYYMSKKAVFFNDSETLTKILNEKNPGEQKKLGRQVAGFVESLWYGEGSEENPAKKAMFDGNYLKYSQNEWLKKALLNTGNTLLVEASPFDNRWGIAMGVDNPNIGDPEQWRGKNWLGEVLTEVRERLRYEDNRKYLF